MTQEIIIAGFGGQGVLSMGKILAYAALMEGREVSWMPAYGPEQRGGTANVTVIVSDKSISSPILSSYDTAILLNQPSVDKFQPKVKRRSLDLRWLRRDPAAHSRRHQYILRAGYDNCHRNEVGKMLQHVHSRQLSESAPHRAGGKCDESAA